MVSVQVKLHVTGVDVWEAFSQLISESTAIISLSTSCYKVVSRSVSCLQKICLSMFSSHCQEIIKSATCLGCLAILYASSSCLVIIQAIIDNIHLHGDQLGHIIVLLAASNCCLDSSWVSYSSMGFIMPTSISTSMFFLVAPFCS